MTGNDAVISDCGTYRYALQREGWLTGAGTVLFVMLNPSTADVSVNDPTIRRCIRFAQDWGFNRLTVANLYAFRATQPAELATVDDPVGLYADPWIYRLCTEASEVIVAWGAGVFASVRRQRDVLDILTESHAPLCLGTTQGGQPRHPLYIRADQQPVPFLTEDTA